jgi:hypothetical protein
MENKKTPPDVDGNRHDKTIHIEFNHLIIFAKDKQASALFLAELFDLPEPETAGFFTTVRFSNNVTFQYAEFAAAFTIQHYAFLVPESTFDTILNKIRERKIECWADPRKQLPNEFNTNHGGRGLYFLDPSGHGMEIITQPYSS